MAETKVSKTPREHAEESPGRAWLKVQAVTWRCLMGIGMFLHRLPSPYPVKAAFQRKMTVKEPFLPGEVVLQFFTPKGYNRRPKGKKYPIILNFHGGGFTIGTATDDARWFTVAMDQLDCVVCSVDYRLAPEHPYPVGMQDGVAAMHWLQKHAEELDLDISRVITTGFSAGGNFCFTSPMMYSAEVRRKKAAIESGDVAEPHPIERATGITNTGELRVLAVAAFYPSVDFTRGRPYRRSMNPSPAHELPYYLTDLFDASYLHPAEELDMADPFLSPAVAKADVLQNNLPEDVIIHTCEFDGLADEGRRFAERLEELGKKVFYREIKGVAHAFDRHPAMSIPPSVRACYMEVCSILKGLLLEPKTAGRDEPLPGLQIGVPSVSLTDVRAGQLNRLNTSASVQTTVTMRSREERRDGPKDLDLTNDVNSKKNPNLIVPSDKAYGRSKVDKSTPSVPGQ